jgi:NAD(P)-dependent dehydrogenase (short-subunit alcohol dehydrogenase family)
MSKPIALITGANKGIGFETARQLGKRGYTVLAAGRDGAKVEIAAEKLRAEGFDVSAVTLDVTKSESAMAAAKWVESKFDHLDVLINNAGILLERSGVIEANLDNLRNTYETNVVGVVAVTQAFLPLLKKSRAGRIVNVSSGLGSLALRQDPASMYAQVKAAAYNSSKSALNMLTVILAQELAGTNIKVNIADPGYTATDLNNNMGTQTVEEGTQAIVRLATLDDAGPTGQYFDRNGPVPW